jgi:predicted TIM-barrel fold metal-dependent hydrolase
VTRPSRGPGSGERTFPLVFGRIVDVDSHLMVPPDILEHILGPLAAADIGLEYTRRLFAGPVPPPPDSFEAAWRAKGAMATDARPSERVRLMDLMGIARQLVVPNTDFRLLFERTPEAHDAVRRYNDHAVAWGRETGRRCVVAGLLNMTDVRRAMGEVERALQAGVGALSVACNEPPAGHSPAAPEWEPLWQLLAEARVPAVLHVGSAGITGRTGFPDPRWGPPEPGVRRLGASERAVTFLEATSPMAAQVYLAALILGGVFERLPGLRFALLEQTAGWVGPWAERLDWVVRHFGASTRVRLALKPSEYLARQVRVAPMWIEPVGGFIERHGLEDVYAFGSDFPHPEGGSDPVRHLMESLRPLGVDVIEKFFVRNGEVLLPPV